MTANVCPKCGSTETKAFNPYDNSMQCAKCGYVGVFLQVDQEKIKEVQEEIKSQKDDLKNRASP